MSQRRSPGPNAVTYEQDGTNLAEASPPLTLTQTHTKFRRGATAVAARRPPGSPWLSRRGAAAGAAGPILTHPSEGGGAARTSATSGVPSAAARGRPSALATPARPAGTRRRPRRVPPPAVQTHLAAAPRRGRRRGRERRARGGRRAGPASVPRRGPAQRRLPGRRGREA